MSTHDALSMTLAARTAWSAAAIFLVTGLVTGIWKYAHVMRPPDHSAPTYVDIAHRAALRYAFAAMLLAELATLSAWPDWVNMASVCAVVAFFAIAIGTYVVLGITDHTDNQFRTRSFVTTYGMALLIAAELGGSLILATGALTTLWG